MTSNTEIQLVLPTSSFTSSYSSYFSTQINFSVKLNSRNYLAWKTQLIPLLNSQDLMGYIDGTLSPPPSKIMDTNNPLFPIPNPAF